MTLGWKYIRRIASVACVAALAWAVLPANEALAGPFVANGNFSATTVNTGPNPNSYLCNNNTPGSCVSQLTSWSATCSAGGCGGSSSPSSILLSTAPNSGYGTWNGGIGGGLYYTDGLGNPIGGAPAGGNIVALDGDHNPDYSTVLSQQISNLTIGGTYVLSFYQASTQQGGSSGATTNDLHVTLGGSTVNAALMSAPSQRASDWQYQALYFVATATSELLSFTDYGTPNGEPPVALLADVQLNVPEPAELALFLGGVVTLTMIRRRRARLG